ncbi:ATP-binding cassette domain-containing protein [Kribbella monticola]|uniref:ATP-binding cassette domain-containing protein n=1 Tax=Kribbella monticola TaxID=2185285 RepID=UPI0018E540A7|nr:ABC transporter ATP-binding protein [Kribbella monticola]
MNLRRSDDLPPVGVAVWRSLRLAYSAEPKLVVASGAVSLIGAVLDGTFALWVALIAKGIGNHDSRLVYLSAVALAVCVAGGWLLQTAASRVERNLRLRLRITIEGHVARMQATLPGLEHHERPEYLSRLAVLRDGVLQLGMIYGDLFATAGAAVRVAVTVALLASVNPLFALLLLFAVPPLLVASKRAGVLTAVEERSFGHLRLAEHLFDLVTKASSAKEVKVTNRGDDLLARRRREWRTWRRGVTATRWRTALAEVCAWGLFAAAYVVALLSVLGTDGVTASQVLLVLTAGSRLAQYVGMTAGAAGSLRQWLDASRRLAWLEDYAAAATRGAGQPAPDRFGHGIELRDVSFRYPGTDQWVLRHVSTDIPSGSVVAVVGVNGAGKSTLVKLLSGFYPCTEGEIRIDGVDIRDLDARSWREVLSGAYQDFHQFEFTAGLSVGIGDQTRMTEPAAILQAVGKADANGLVDDLANGLETQLGPSWPGGTDLSGGQWQRIALARGFMRPAPLLMVLDEPTAALDAETEHALFVRFAAEARRRSEDMADSGAITVLVSHRFSTVRMADTIIVLSGAAIVETGSHDELMALDGVYAELYGLQADAYL